MKRARHRVSSGGFTLVEILVALGLLMIGMTTIAALFAIGLDQLRKARVRSQSGEAAPALMQAIESALLDQVHMDLNAQLIDFENGPQLPDVLDQKEQTRVPGMRHLSYSYRATRVPGRELEYLAEIKLHWEVAGQESGRVLKSVFDLRPSLARLHMSNKLKYRPPAGGFDQGDNR